MTVMIHPEECGGCAACVDACPSDALLETATAIAHLPNECSDCGLCITICPCGAIEAVAEP